MENYTGDEVAGVAAGEYYMKSRPDLDWRPPSYTCPTHGVTTNIMNIVTDYGDYAKVISADYCLLCFRDHLDNTIGRVSPA